MSLLTGELAFGDGSEKNDHARIGILAGSLLAAVVLRIRNRHYRRLAEIEERDADADGIPDVYQNDARI